MNGSKTKRSKKLILFFGIGVIIFLVLLAAAAITVSVLNVFTKESQFDAYVISFIALTTFSLLLSAGIVLLLYITAQKLNILIENLNRVAAGDYTAEIQFRRRDTFARVFKNFNKMTRELNSVKSMREDFVQTLSHEIKTPLFSIQGFASLIAEGGLSEEEEQKFLAIISGEAARLIRLADSTLTLSKLENQQMPGEIKSVRLDGEINECIVMLEREWNEKNIDVTADLQPVKAECDAPMLRRVWLNILSNAIKFTPAGGKIEVGLSAAGGFAEAVFKDSGCGIPESEREKIFGEFYRSPAAKDYEGNGLGLAICKRICVLCGGEISVSANPAGGSIFTVRLPLTQIQ